MNTTNNNQTQLFPATTPATPSRPLSRHGKVRPMILLWALGVPIPIILVLLLIRGCTG